MYLGFTKIGPFEVVVIFAVILLVFGPSKLPQIGNAIGKGIRKFRGASKDIKEQLDVDLNEKESIGEEKK